MLRHVIPSPQITQSMLRKAISIEVVSRRAYSSKAWSTAQQHRRQTVSPVRRPIVNGQIIPFHVNELLVNNFNNAATAPTPPSSQQYESDLVVVLDMDECLIHSQFLDNPVAAQVYAHQLQQKRRSTPSTNQAQVENFRFTLPDGELVHVNLRPGLNDFLQKVCSKYETHIFTAAVPIYANPVLNALDPDNTLFAGRWYRDSCVFDAQQQAHVKNLSKLPLPHLDRVVLVDNNPLSFLANPNNGILVSSFYNDAADDTLHTVWQLLEALDNERDVRPKLQQIFNLEMILQEQRQQQQQQIKF